MPAKTVRTKSKGFPPAQIRRCAYRAGVLSISPDSVRSIAKYSYAEAKKIIQAAAAYKGSKRSTIRVVDIKNACGQPVYGARECRRAKSLV